MPFDLSTARPVQDAQPSAGFDISTARPAQETAENDIFAGLPPETVEQIKTQFPDIQREESALQTANPFGDEITSGFVGPDPQKGIEADQMRAANLERIRLENPILAEEIENMSPGQQDLIGMGRFFSTTGSGIKRLLGLMDEQEVERLKEDTAAYDKLANVKPRVKLAEGMAAAPALVAGGGATAAVKATAPRIAAGVGIGAVEGGIPSLGAGEDATEAAKKAAIGAGLNTVAGEMFTLGRMSPAKQKIKEILERDPANKTVAKYMVDGAGNVQTNRFAKEAIRQGFDDGVVAVAKGASKADKARMLRMIKTVEKGRENALFAAKNRPSDVVGESLAKRVKFVQRANQKAASKLDQVANSLKGKPVDYGSAVDDFIDDLDSLGVQYNPKTASVSFRGSDVEGLDGPQNIINRVVKRMKNTRAPDAYDVHRMKRFIDQQVTYGKSAEGLSGQAESIIKNLRRNLDASLDNTFPRYNKVNTQYSDTIQALDDYQKAVGTTIDFTSPNIDKALGTVSRRFLSNAQSRVRQMDMLDNLETVAKKYGAKFEDDVMSQVLFVDELDSVFGPSARTSLQGDVAKNIDRAAQAGQQSTLKNAADLTAAGVRKIRGVNEEKALEAIKGVLRQ